MPFTWDDEVEDEGGQKSGFAWDDDQVEVPAGFSWDAAAPIPAPSEKGYFGNTLSRVGERAAELGGQLLSGLDVVAQAAEESMPMGGFVFEVDSILPVYKSAEEYKTSMAAGTPNLMADTAEGMKGIDFNSAPRHTWDEVKRHFAEEGVTSGMGEVFKAIGETGATSLPDMVFAVLNLPTYVLTRSSEIGAARAKNKGKTSTDLTDILEAAPVALGSAILERVGAKAVLGLGKGATKEIAEQVGKGALKTIAKGAGVAAATEGGTEFIQEGIIEYVGERFGTDAKMNFMEAVDVGTGAAVLGGGFGASMNLAASSAQAVVPTTAQTIEVPSMSENARSQALDGGADALGAELAASDGLAQDIAADAGVHEQAATDAQARAIQEEADVEADALIQELAGDPSPAQADARMQELGEAAGVPVADPVVELEEAAGVPVAEPSVHEQAAEAAQERAVQETTVAQGPFPEMVHVGPVSFKPKAITGELYRETNAAGISDMLQETLSNNVERGSVTPTWVADNKDMALGQGTNKGVQVVFDGDLVSGTIGTKPGIGIEGVTGKEYQTDFIGKDAIKSFTLPKGERLGGVARAFAKSQFDIVKNEDGSTTYTRKEIAPKVPAMEQKKAEVPKPPAMEQKKTDAQADTSVTITDDKAGKVTIQKEGKDVGEITYTETNNTIQIKRADVTTPGEGIGTDAYAQFINEKVAEGKSVESDAVVSDSAQGVYAKLEAQGYGITKSENTRPMMGKITTISKEDMKAQRIGFGTVRDPETGAIVTKPGGVFKGDPVYKITSVPQKKTDAQQFTQVRDEGIEGIETAPVFQGKDKAFEITAPTDIGSDAPSRITVKAVDGTGVLDAQVTEGNTYQISSARVEEASRGKGIGTAMYENMITFADSQGYEIVSDKRVSAAATGIYKSLEKKGYTVTPSADITFDDAGNARSATHAYSVSAKPAEVVTPKVPAMEQKKADVQAEATISIAPTPIQEAVAKEKAKGKAQLAKQKERHQAKDDARKAKVVEKKESAMAAKKAVIQKREEVDAAAAQAQTSPKNDLPEPTQAEIDAGNYKKGHVTLKGLDITIENPKGSLRKGVSATGKAWSTRMKNHYGYIKKTMGADGDQVDVFLGPDVDSDFVYVVDQVDPTTGKFDEHKVIIGATSEKAAREIYKRNYAKGWKGNRATTKMAIPEFKAWLADGDTASALEPSRVDTAPPPPPVPPTPPTEPTAAEKAAGFDAPVETFTDRVRRTMQDKMHPLRQTQTEIEKATGVESLPDDINALMAEEAFYGKTENDLRKLKEGPVQEFTDVMADKGLAIEEMNMYLIAKHAQERNAAIARINPDMPEGGSGMTLAEADVILGSIDDAGRTADFEAAAQPIYDILQMQRDTIKNSGLEVSDVVDSWEAGYQFYVPLKGVASDEITANYPKRSGGFTIKGRETIRALGRRSKAESPAVHAIMDATAAITRARKNEVGNVLLKLVEQNPNPEYWQVFTAAQPDTKRGIKLIEGVEVVTDIKVNNMGSDNYFTTKLDGVEYKIKINDVKLLRALHNLGPEPLGPVLKALGSVTRTLSSLHTTYNPEFVVTNAARDIQTAVLNVLAEQDIPGGKIKGEALALSMAKSAPRAMRAIHASLHGKQLTGKNAEWQKTYEKFREAGAQTGWFDQKDFDGQAKEIKAMMTGSMGGVKGNTKKYAKTVTDFVHHANTAVENAVRLSLFKHAVDAGVSEQKAASMAKNLTVNFNRKGEIGAALNTAYMFANASIQGTATFARAMGTMSKDLDTGKRKLNPAQKTAIVLAGVGAGLSALNRDMAGDDEDGVNYYDKVPDYVRDRNIVIMESVFGGEPGKYYTFPLPYAYNIFHVFGDQVMSMAAGAKSPGQAAVNTVASLAGSISPLGLNFTLEGEFHKEALRTVTPTVLSPLAQLAINENFFGSPIYKENMVFGKQYPDSTLGKASTGEHWKTVAKWLNEATGGKEYISGGIDVNPDSLKFIAEFAAGGAGSFVIRTVDYANKKAAGRDIAPHEVPFKRKAMGEVRPFKDMEQFYKRREKIGQHELQRDHLDSRLERRKFTREHDDLLDMSADAKRTAKRLRHLRKRRQKAIDATTGDIRARDARVKEVEVEIKSALAKFNKKYNEEVKGK